MYHVRIVYDHDMMALALAMPGFLGGWDHCHCHRHFVSVPCVMSQSEDLTLDLAVMLDFGSCRFPMSFPPVGDLFASSASINWIL